MMHSQLVPLTIFTRLRAVHFEVDTHLQRRAASAGSEHRCEFWFPFSSLSSFLHVPHPLGRSLPSTGNSCGHMPPSRSRGHSLCVTILHQPMCWSCSSIVSAAAYMFQERASTRAAALVVIAPSGAHIPSSLSSCSFRANCRPLAAHECSFPGLPMPPEAS